VFQKVVHQAHIHNLANSQRIFTRHSYTGRNCWERVSVLAMGILYVWPAVRLSRPGTDWLRPG